jgi:hypothetical protein
VNASSISIAGTPVIDGNGGWVGQPLTVDWSNVTNIPGDIADGDANTQLSETQVEGFINNGAIDLHPSTTMNGSGLLTQADVLTPDWTNVTDQPGSTTETTTPSPDSGVTPAKSSAGTVSVGSAPPTLH